MLVSVETTTGDWKRLGRCIKGRREQLRLSQQDMYARGGPSVATIRNLEAGSQEGYRNRTYYQVEESLGWAEGSVEAALAGREPTPLQRNVTPYPDTIEATVTPEPTPERTPDHRRSTEDIRREIAEIMSRMTPEEIARVERGIAEEEAELARMMAQRQLRWMRLMRGEPPITD